MYGEAYLAFSEARLISPTNALLAYYQALAAANMQKNLPKGSEDKIRYRMLAEDAYAIALRLKPDFKEALYGSAIFYAYELGQLDKALSFINRLVTINAKDERAWLLKAQIHSSLAVVGARKACMEAIKRTRELGRELAKTNVCVVSGLAYGVDTAIHEGLTEEGGQSFSVLATPLDNIYPKSNRSLAGAILYHGGGLLSETAPLESVGKYTFVKRNRIISGLSLATLVMAAEKKSGALLTAQFAVDEGREVFIWNDEHAGEGALTFLEQGAQTFISLHDLSSVLRINFREPTLALATNRLVGFKEKEIGKRAIEDSLVEDLLKELNS
ncbi:UNVERIFIED_CONTAM: hypothetical protein PYX00_010919 [Menopon gallinae]|uniref:Smf/DprA SLOG domain-containing protein n=1 Tax=Menopon gallinae TaxID=328185 RepID=A0AAW2H6U4_9NEOP